jgi:hypothetical protein
MREGPRRDRARRGGYSVVIDHRERLLRARSSLDNDGFCPVFLCEAGLTDAALWARKGTRGDRAESDSWWGWPVWRRAAGEFC